MFLILINVTTMYFKKEPVAIDALLAIYKKGLSLPMPHWQLLLFFCRSHIYKIIITELVPIFMNTCTFNPSLSSVAI